MKKTFVLVLALLAVFALAITAPAALAEDGLTVADIYAAEGAEITQSAVYDNCFVCAGTYDGKLVRVTAASTPDVLQGIFDLDFFSPDYDEKYLALVGPLAVSEIEDLTAQIPPQEQLDALAGLSGAALLEEGWTHSSWDLDSLEFTMNHGPFSYAVVFEGEVPSPDTFDEYGDMDALTVKSVTFLGLGDGATDIDPFSFGPMIDVTGSELYTEEDLGEAVDLILSEFDSWPEGCELHSLYYAGDEACGEEELAWLNTLSGAEGRQFTQGVEFLSEFAVSEDSEQAGAFEPGMLYTDWQWWLAREDGGEWVLLTWGY